MKVTRDLKLDNLNQVINTCRTNKKWANQRKKKEMREIAYFIKGMPKMQKYPYKCR